MLSTTSILFALAAGAAAKSVSTTPHDKYSSSVGVLGCKINTNRVAYWPGSIDCDNICIKLTKGDRSVHLLRIDQSGGAHDISYDAWSYLQTGKSAQEDPQVGGGVAMEYEEVDASECADLLDNGKVPLSASNSINFLSSCLEQPNSFIAKNHKLYNICDAICTVGHDEECKLDLSVSNQPSCPHTLGLQTELKSAPVVDVAYQSGDLLLAGSGDPAPSNVKGPAAGGSVKAEVSSGSEETVEETPEEPEEVVEEPAEKPTQEPGVFFELTSTSVEVPVYETTAAVTTAAPPAPSTTEAAPVPEVTTSAEVSSSAPVEIPTETSSLETSAPVALPTPIVPSTNTTSTFVFVPSASKSGSAVSSSSTPTSSPTGGESAPGTSSTPDPDSASRHSASVPVLALVSSIIVCLTLGSL